MVKKDKKMRIIVSGIVALILVGVFMYYITQVYQSPVTKRNGYFDEETQQCWSAKNHPPGVAYPADEVKGELSMCCFNIIGEQIDCQDSTKLLGPIVQQEFVTVDDVPLGGGGMYFMQAVITFTNNPANGGADIDALYIDILDWDNAVGTPVAGSNILWAEWNVEVGSEYAQAAPLGTAVDFHTNQVDLRDVAGPPGSPYEYTFYMEGVGEAFDGQLSNTQVYTKTFTVEEETLGFSLDIAWGLS